jgi:phenylalanyl-tRNA synthetase beta chain
MKIGIDVLRRFTDLPDDLSEVRSLLDDIGVEVKRMDGDQFTLELLANRGDHHGYWGLATEVSGRTGKAVRWPTYAELDVGQSAFPIRLETPLCLQYSGTVLVREGAGELGPDELRTLEAGASQSIGPVIDATNLSSLELGQPTHAFDADKIVGSVVIRTSLEGEQAWPLFQEEKVVLPVGTLVIADEVKVLAIAGVIGCQESRTTDETRRVLLESATFEPVTVRKASRALGIQTTSSARFERGADPSMVVVGAGRVVSLLEGAGWRREGATTLLGDWTDPERDVRLDPDHAREFLGVDTSDDEMLQRLGRYGFTARRDGEVYQVRVPPHRLWDVESAQDLYEEVVKSIGYNDTPIGLPMVQMGALQSPEEIARETIDGVLIGQGFYEVVTDGFYGRGMREKLGVEEGHPLWRHVETSNALDRAYSLLKNNTLGQAVETISTNLRMANHDVKAFEWTRTFHAEAGRFHESVREQRVLWAVVNGAARPGTWAGAERPADPLFLKGVLAELALTLGLPLEIRGRGEHPVSTLLHPNRQADVWLGDERIGVLGEVHPEVLRGFRIKRARPCFLELRAEPLLRTGTRPAYSPPRGYHLVERNLAFTLPHRVEAGEVQAHLIENGPEWLERVDIVDQYDHEHEGQPVRTITFALAYANEEAQRTAEEANAASEGLIASVQTAFGERGVVLR